ncbi:MAG: hypothetical protein AAF962_19940 [Actinomycetota bacterium]
MTTSSTPDDDHLAEVVSIDQERFDPLVDDYLAAIARQERPDDELVGRLGAALPSPSRALRGFVVALAGLQLVAVLPWLIGIDPLGLLGDSSDAHLTRDGALGFCVAAAALLAAWRPHWARPAFAIASVAIIAQTAAGALDDSAATGGNELIHLPSVALACLTGALAIRLADLAPSLPRSGRS